MDDATTEFSSVTVDDSSTLPALNIVRSIDVKILYVLIAVTLTLLDLASRNSVNIIFN